MLQRPPSKKIMAMMSIAIIIVVGVITTDLIKKHLESKKMLSATSGPTAEDILPHDRVVAMDADNDGLFDWEEALRGTNPQNADTDGDGTVDGTEVRSGRDPLTKGPNDSFGQSNAPVFFTDTQYVPGSLSEHVASDFISNYLLLSQAGRLDDETVSQLSKEVVDEAYAAATLPDRYTIFNLKTFSDLEKERVHQYGNTFANTYATYYIKIDQVENSDPDAYIATISSLYISFAEELARIPVPEGVASAHLDFTNNTYRISQALPFLPQANSDPVRTLFIVNQYKAIAPAQAEITKTIATYFKSNGILFSKDELGSMWNAL